MRQFVNLLRYELRILFLAPGTYVAAITFLCLMACIYLFIIQEYNQAPQENLSSTELFRSFWIPVFFVVPLLTMKSISEEKRLGTLETLLTTSVTPIQIVLSKFLSSYIFYIVLWLIVLSYPLIVQYFISSASTSPSLSDTASLIGGLSFVATSGTLYLSLGIFASSLTRSQLVAGTFCFFLLFLVIVGERILLETEDWIKITDFPLDYFQTFRQLEDFSRGIIDSRPFFFYFGNSLLILGLTSFLLKIKN